VTSLISGAATPPSAALRSRPENGEIEYGGLPVSHSIFAILLGCNVFDCPIREMLRVIREDARAVLLGRFFHEDMRGGD
jgi:hypothetical protein